MIISHRYRFIFIKTVKTAGTSIEVFLSGRCAEQDVFTPILPPVAPHRARNFGDFYNHVSASEVKAAVPDEIWRNYFKFCVERNPWDKVLSLHRMLRHRSGMDIPFDEFLSGKNDAFKLALNYPRYTDRAGDRLIVDRVLRYERLDEELGDVFGMLGVPYNGTLDVHAKSDAQAGQRLPYRQIYTDRQNRLVEQAYKKEIDLHGYRFSGSD